MWILPALFCHPDNTWPRNRTSGLPMHIEPRIKAQQKSTVLSFRYPNMLPGYSIRQYRECFHRNISGNLLVTELDLFKMRTCQSGGVQQRDIEVILTFSIIILKYSLSTPGPGFDTFSKLLLERSPFTHSTIQDRCCSIKFLMQV